MYIHIVCIHFSALAMNGHFLLLFFAVLQVCSATEYYVKPTEPTDTTCPGQPCLTLNEYTNDTDYYIKSNTVFIFLPGKHHMDRPLQVIDLQNVTLKSTDNDNVQSLLVPQCEVHGQCLEIEYPDVSTESHLTKSSLKEVWFLYVAQLFTSSMSHMLI